MEFMLKINNFCIAAFSTLLIYSIVLFFYYNKSQDNAIIQAEIATKEFLRNQKATKIFFNNDQKKSIKTIYKNHDIYATKFLPEFYSCTYASTTINNYYNELRAKDGLSAIEISFISSNPKNDKNMAIEEEKILLKKFNKQILYSYSKIIKKNGDRYLYLAKPAQKVTQDCLECHGKPSDAPLALIKEYGESQGFNHKKGEIRALIKILMPLEPYLKDARNLFILIAVSSLCILIFIFILVRIFVNKNRRESKKFQTVIDNLDELIIVRSNDKTHSINSSFMKFFGVKSAYDFKEQYSCISTNFIESKESISLDLSTIDDKLIKKLKNTEKINRVVKIANSKGELHILSIKIDRLQEDEDLYVIVLSDVTKLQQRADKFEKRANIDSLTGAFSRAKFNNQYASEFARSTRYLNPLTIVFIDIDHFKSINDSYGHDIGDITLKTFSELISRNIREFDLFARWGGEEFILMLPQTNINDGYKLAEKIRISIASHKFKAITKLTCSIGISMLCKGDDTKSLIKRADTALYKAKTTGRNKTIIEI